MGMSFLQGLGGLGAGLMTAQQIMRQQENDKANNQLRAAQAGLADIRLNNAKKELDNEAAYGDIAGKEPGTQTILRADAPADEWGQQQTETIAKPRGSVFDEMAAEALKRGDQAGFAKFTQYGDHLKKQQGEGVTDIAKMVYLGAVNPAAAEKAFNSVGQMRVAPGTVKWNADTGTLSGIDASTGQPISMNKDAAKQYLTLAGSIKPDEWISGGDGQAINRRTGEVKGDPRGKPIVVNGTVGHYVTNGDGSRTFVQDFTAPKQPSVVIHQGNGAGPKGGLRVAKTIETSDGYIAVMSDGTQQQITGADGKPAKGLTGKKIAATLVGKTINQYGDNGDIAGKVNTLADGLDGQGKPAGDARSYLSGATSQEDFNTRVKELKAKGWTNDQIKAAAQ